MGRSKDITFTTTIITIRITVNTITTTIITMAGTSTTVKAQRVSAFRE